jgi:hypothetical protein
LNGNSSEKSLQKVTDVVGIKEVSQTERRVVPP